jgi:hypothetical protein
MTCGVIPRSFFVESAAMLHSCALTSLALNSFEKKESGKGGQ